MKLESPSAIIDHTSSNKFPLCDDFVFFTESERVNKENQVAEEMLKHAECESQLIQNRLVAEEKRKKWVLLKQQNEKSARKVQQQQQKNDKDFQKMAKSKTLVIFHQKNKNVTDWLEHNTIHSVMSEKPDMEQVEKPDKQHFSFEDVHDHPFLHIPQH